MMIGMCKYCAKVRNNCTADEVGKLWVQSVLAFFENN